MSLVTLCYECISKHAADRPVKFIGAFTDYHLCLRKAGVRLGHCVQYRTHKVSTTSAAREHGLEAYVDS